MEHTILLSCCDCEPIAVTMARARLWPATAQNPRLAFTFELLDWAEALLYECQIALKDLWAALRYKCPHLVNKVCNWKRGFKSICASCCTAIPVLTEEKCVPEFDWFIWGVQVHVYSGSIYNFHVVVLWTYLTGWWSMSFGILPIYVKSWIWVMSVLHALKWVCYISTLFDA